MLSSLGKRIAGWATYWTQTPHGDMASSNSQPDGDSGSSNSRPDGDSGSSNRLPLLQDTPSNPQAAAREGNMSIRLAALS